MDDVPHYYTKGEFIAEAKRRGLTASYNLEYLLDNFSTKDYFDEFDFESMVQFSCNGIKKFIIEEIQYARRSVRYQMKETNYSTGIFQQLTMALHALGLAMEVAINTENGDDILPKLEGLKDYYQKMSEEAKGTYNAFYDVYTTLADLTADLNADMFDRLDKYWYNYAPEDE